MGGGPPLITQTILSLLGQDAGTWIPPSQWDRSPCKLQVHLCLSPYPPHGIDIAFPTPSTWHVTWNSMWVPTEPQALPAKASCSSPCSCRGEPRAHRGVQGAGPNQAFCGEHTESGPSTVRRFGVQTTLADKESCRNLQMGILTLCTFSQVPFYQVGWLPREADSGGTGESALLGGYREEQTISLPH